MTGIGRELTPHDVLADLLGSGDFPAEVLDAEGAAKIILRRLEDAGFAVMSAGREVRESSPADAALGVLWWNHLNARERKRWMEAAGNTGVVADAWEAFKASQRDEGGKS